MLVTSRTACVVQPLKRAEQDFLIVKKHSYMVTLRSVLLRGSQSEAGFKEGGGAFF